MYKVIINKGQGFTEVFRQFKTIKEACNYAKYFDNIKIYKNNKRIY